MMAELVSGGENSVVFWEGKTLNKRRSAQPFPDSSFSVSSLSWSSSNSKLAVVPKNGDRVAVCDFKDDILTWSYLVQKEVSSSFTCGCILSSGRQLVSGCGDSALQLWDIKHKNIVKSFDGHSDSISSVAVTNSDQLLVSGGLDGSVLLHPLAGAGRTVTLSSTDQTHSINKLCISHMDPSHLGCIHGNGEVSLWSIESQRKLITFPSKSGGALDLSFSPTNKILMVSVGEDAHIRCYDLQTRKVVANIAAPAPLSSVAILHGGGSLLAGGTNGQLYLYELRSLKTPKKIVEAHQSAVSCIALQSTVKMPGKRSSLKAPRPQSSAEASQWRGSPVTTSLPSTVTPFVTARPQLEVQTPYSVLRPEKRQFVMATPASSDNNLSSMFSPLDSQLSETPLTTSLKVTATVPPTKRQEVTTPTSTPAVVQSLPVVSMLTPAVQRTSDPSEIFSPLETRIGQSPLLLSHDSQVTSVPSVTATREPIAESINIAQSAVVSPPARAERSSSLDSSVSSGGGPSEVGVAPLSSGLHKQYFERTLRDSNDELWYLIHRDTRFLTVDMIRQFVSLQEGLASQFAALNDKIDRLSEQNKQLTELVHQYMPKH